MLLADARSIRRAERDGSTSPVRHLHAHGRGLSAAGLRHRGALERVRGQFNYVVRWRDDHAAARQSESGRVASGAGASDRARRPACEAVELAARCGNRRRAGARCAAQRGGRVVRGRHARWRGRTSTWSARPSISVGRPSSTSLAEQRRYLDVEQAYTAACARLGSARSPEARAGRTK